ncbi:response regulator transcription factor [Roseateles sp.]|uniref:response regulator transcription factor n=1 Tax=Roseateles sp. TaxID=1971397 RepID=UPI0025EA7242|nr:response regulator transcription factor [Roseateles sp.]MBV8037748.1 response regulator transcription factor [Roseateles sp.]
MSCRALIAEDHDIVRSGLRMLLERIEGVVVVAECRTGRELLNELVNGLAVDVVITDISMPDMDGLAALARIKLLPAPPAVIVVSMHDSPDIIRRVHHLGADAYLLKEESPMELQLAVQSVARGMKYYGPRVTQRLLQSSEPSPEQALTERQIEILQSIGRGMATKEIAFELGLSPKTVDVHRARIMERLGIDDQVGLALYCVRHGMVDPASPRKPGRPA